MVPSCLFYSVDGSFLKLAGGSSGTGTVASPVFFRCLAQQRFVGVWISEHSDGTYKTNVFIVIFQACSLVVWKACVCVFHIYLLETFCFNEINTFYFLLECYYLIYFITRRSEEVIQLNVSIPIWDLNGLFYLAKMSFLLKSAFPHASSGLYKMVYSTTRTSCGEIFNLLC